jgi:hypothetical protein
LAGGKGRRQHVRSGDGLGGGERARRATMTSGRTKLEEGCGMSLAVASTWV